MISISTLFFKPLWQSITRLWGMRSFMDFLKRKFEAYTDTIAYFETEQPLVALTIDDGLLRNSDASKSMAPQVLECLDKYQAHATFFVCTDYIKGQDEAAHQLLAEGHELGNHLEADKAFYYNKLPQDEFQTILESTNATLYELDHAQHRWFRAAQGILTKPMAQAVAAQHENGTSTMTHVLADCYCDDWLFEQEVDGKPEEQRQKRMKQVANILLSQVQPGSIALLHMPEVGFREGALDALEFFLQGVQEKGYRCVTLTELQALVASEHQAGQATANHQERKGAIS